MKSFHLDGHTFRFGGLLKVFFTLSQIFLWQRKGCVVRFLYRVSVFCMANYFDIYLQLTNKELDESIENEMSGDLEKGFLALGR